MTRGLFIHAVVYAVLNALLVGIWLVTTGSTDTLSLSRHDPLQALRDGMWPIVVIACWGAGLVIHAAVVVAYWPSRARRRMRRHVAAVHKAKEKARARERERTAAPAAPVSGKQLVTAMFTDLVGSTELAEQLGDQVWHSMLADHRTLVRGAISGHSGHEVGTQGDGFLVRFSSPDAAVACATEIQRAMAAQRTSGSFMPELRVGVHAGEAMADDNDLIGRVINLASRVTSAAGSGEILVTEPVADHLSPGVTLIDRGLVTLKGIAQPRHLLAVDWRLVEQIADITVDVDADQANLP
jgi:class 3 adenylate cyclase